MGREEKGLHSSVPMDVGGWAWRLMRHFYLMGVRRRRFLLSFCISFVSLWAGCFVRMNGQVYITLTCSEYPSRVFNIGTFLGCAVCYIQYDPLSTLFLQRE